MLFSCILQKNLNRLLQQNVKIYKPRQHKAYSNNGYCSNLRWSFERKYNCNAAYMSIIFVHKKRKFKFDPPFSFSKIFLTFVTRKKYFILKTLTTRNIKKLSSSIEPFYHHNPLFNNNINLVCILEMICLAGNKSFYIKRLIFGWFWIEISPRIKSQNV